MNLTCILLIINCQHSVFTQLTESVPLSGSLICDHMERWKKIRQKYVTNEKQLVLLLKRITSIVNDQVLVYSQHWGQGFIHGCVSLNARGQQI